MHWVASDRPLRHIICTFRLALQLRFFPLLAICVTMVQRSWMTGGSVEATLELWAASLRTVKERIRPLFRQDRTAAAAGLCLDALLGPERRKTGGCERKPPGIRVPGASRRSSIEAGGRPMR